MILVTGSNGQIGSDLVIALQRESGAENVLTSGRHLRTIATHPPYEVLDVTHKQCLQTLVDTYAIDTIYHLAGVLSAKGERYPEQCWQVNIKGLKNVLEIARQGKIKVFWPSSIAVFGPHTPRLKTPQTTIEDPTTMYGITKATGEMLCQYYAQHFQVDVRSVRFPGIISHRTLPGGGTTDFAVEMFHAALTKGHYTCFVEPETRLPMMYMLDAIRAMLELMRVKPDALTIRSSYNLAAISFSAAELAAEIQQYLPHFTCDYTPDYRQSIAESWPNDIDDSTARQDWQWQYQYDLSVIVKDMLWQLSKRLPNSKFSLYIA